MQGVNVFARWIDPSTGLPSDQYAARRFPDSSSPAMPEIPSQD